MIAVVSPPAYWTTVGVAAVVCILLCTAARRHPGPWRVWAARLIGLALAADLVAYTVSLSVAGTWSPATSLPLALCDVGVVVAAVACWWQVALLVEMTYFWGLAGTLQAVVTPDVSVGFPHLRFFEYLFGHLGIVAAALFLVVGLRLKPRRGAVARVFVITAAYTAFVGVVDWAAGANYMFLRKPPPEWTLLRVLGPWPWYVFSAAGVALVLLVLLDLPFFVARHLGSDSTPRTPPSGTHRESSHVAVSENTWHGGVGVGRSLSAAASEYPGREPADEGVEFTFQPARSEAPRG